MDTILGKFLWLCTFVANIFGDLCGKCLKILWILFKANLSQRAFWIKVVFRDIHEPFILSIRKVMKYIVKMQLHKYPFTCTINASQLEACFRFYRLLMKGKVDVYLLLPDFLISDTLRYVRMRIQKPFDPNIGDT